MTTTADLYLAAFKDPGVIRSLARQVKNDEDPRLTALLLRSAREDEPSKMRTIARRILKAAG